MAGAGVGGAVVHFRWEKNVLVSLWKEARAAGHGGDLLGNTLAAEPRRWHLRHCLWLPVGTERGGGGCAGSRVPLGALQAETMLTPQSSRLACLWLT